MVDAVLQQWVTVVTEAEGTAAPDIEGFVQYIQRMAAYLYYDDIFLASTKKTQLHPVFAIFTDLSGGFGM